MSVHLLSKPNLNFRQSLEQELRVSWARQAERFNQTIVEDSTFIAHDHNSDVPR